MTSYPTAEDYILAVQQPEQAFDRPDLARSEFVAHPLLGVPMPASGTTAVVFKAIVDGRPQALRFFTREDASTRQRYNQLNSWFTERGLRGDVAPCAWVDDAIRVGGRRWPMVQMEWIEGSTLDHHVADLVEADDRRALATLAQRWRDLVRRAQSARFAHGDLQHGNVLVQDDGRLRLVDFDSAWIAPFAGGPPPSEVGHRNYQPANRVWGPWMDTFPGLVIYLSLLALARDPRQWERFNDGENLLFRHDDYAPPHRTPAWGQVAQLHDPVVDQLAERLRACCTPGWTATGDLESLLGAPVPWWLQTPSAVRAPQPSPVPRPSPGPRSIPGPKPVPPRRPSPVPRAESAPPPIPQPAQPPVMPGDWMQQWTATASRPVPPEPTAAPKRARRGYAAGTVGLAVLAFMVVALAVTSALQSARVPSADRGGIVVLSGMGAVALVVIVRELWKRRS
ncbi:phosphotransferase [Pseudonocardia sp. CA-107938]|uniref:phosphotransferase n=1 Tax=Pseudonocardia sp. CA-107938 TaxID=3240021 RepID=UPI003D8F8045